MKSIFKVILRIIKDCMRFIIKPLKVFYLYLISYKGKIVSLKVICALLLSFVFTYATYFINNTSINDNAINDYINTKISLFTSITENGKYNQDELLSQVFIVNTSYDKELIPINDSRGLHKGELDITDRGKIAEFLKLMNNEHKFALLALPIHSKFISENDSVLFNQLKKTKRILIPSFMDKDSLINPNYLTDTGFSVYSSTNQNFRFIKYGFFHRDTIKSMAIKMYEELDGKTITKGKFVDVSSGKIAFSSLVLNQRIKAFKKYGEGFKKNYYELGVELLDSLNKPYIRDLIKDKIVLIGDFDDSDFHLTTSGMLSGTMINYNAYLALKNDDHIIPKYLILFVFITYFIFFTGVLFKFKKHCIDFFKKYFLGKYPRKEKNRFFNTKPLLNTLASILFIWLDGVVVLAICSAILIEFFNVHVNFLFFNNYLAVVAIILTALLTSNVENPQND